MPLRKDPPEQDTPPAGGGGDKRGPATQRPEASWADVLATTRPVEAEIAWSDDAASPAAEGEADDAAARAFERVTVAPPVPEREYVARMMSRAIESNTMPAVTEPKPAPAHSLRGDGASTPGVAVPEHGATLMLDLNDSEPPAALTAPTAPAPANPALAFGSTPGEALDLVGARAASVQPGPISVATLRDIRDRVDVGDFSGALSAAEVVLEQDPANADAVVYAEHCRGKLKQMYIARLGGLQRTPRVNTTPEQLRWLALDHRAGFLLSLVDGRSTLDEVLDMSGMAELDALRLLIQLLQQNVLKVD